MVTASDISARAQVLALLESIPDPEVPVLNVLDLGIVRDIRFKTGTESGDARAGLEIDITPTYTGCPAMDAIRAAIRIALAGAGYSPVEIRTVLSPAWTTDWMRPEAREKLEAFGIAPPIPGKRTDIPQLFKERQPITCPHCGSEHTVLLSQFGSTACKALYRCLDCREPFDYFKCH